MKLNAAVVGSGFVGRAHVESLRRLGIPTRGALGSAGETTASACEPRILERGDVSLEQLAADPAVDDVHHCTPNYLHFGEASSLMRAGKHLLCENPLTMDSAVSELVVSLARES